MSQMSSAAVDDWNSFVSRKVSCRHQIAPVLSCVMIFNCDRTKFVLIMFVRTMFMEGLAFAHGRR